MSQSIVSSSTPAKTTEPVDPSLAPVEGDPPYQTARGCLMLTFMLLISMGLMIIAMWLFVDRSA